jgi:hypothetical protein
LNYENAIIGVEDTLSVDTGGNHLLSEESNAIRMAMIFELLGPVIVQWRGSANILQYHQSNVEWSRTEQ